MEHSGHDMGGTMTMMPMTFSNFADYQLKIIFDWWDVQDRFFFFLSWCIVCCSVVVFHSLKYYITVVENKMNSTKKYTSIPSADSANVLNISKEDNTSSSTQYIPSNKLQLRLFHAFLTGISYGMGLLLMLVAMTYNSALFLALVVGYMVGDFLFFHKSEHMMTGNSNSSGECH